MHRRRNGPEQEVDTQPATIFDCANCDRSFPTKIGLSQHRRHAHPVERNNEKLISMKTAGSNWSQQESASLIRCADALAPLCPTRRELHHRLLSHFPGRTLESIRTRLYALNWQRNTVPAANPSTVSQINTTSDIESQAIDHSEWFTCLMQTVITQLESNSEAFLHSDELLAIARGLQAGIFTVVQAKSLLNMNASLAFPYTWRFVTRRRGRVCVRSHLTTKQIRKANYAAIQTLYHQRKKDVALAVFSGNWRTAYKMNRGLPDNSNEYWSEVLSAHAHVDERPSRAILPPDWSLVDPITGEVSRTLKHMGNTAPGLDKLLPKHLKRMKADALAGYFNLFLLTQGCPIHLCRSRITLVPKVNNPSSPTELRPIAVSSTLIRCFHKILADRWNSRLQLPALQFAFLHRDGCLEATSLLHAMLRNSCTTSSSLCAAFIDVSKAFDSISQDSIIRSARAFGAPPPLTHYIADSYRNASVTLNGSVLRSQRGVHQGDPLSPLLFIMAMDEVLELSRPELGYQFHDTLVSGFAYADDLILLAENPTRLSEKLLAAASALELSGLKINTQKTKLMVIRGDHKHNVTAISNESIHFGPDIIHSLSASDTVTYLGIPFTWKGKAFTNHRQQLRTMLDETTKAPLKPHQRLELLRQHLIPKMNHSLVLSRVHRNTLKAMDCTIRQFVRQWLRLPKDTPISYIHTPIRLGGLGIPSLSTTIPISRKSRVERLLSSQCPVLRNVVRDNSFGPILRETNIPVRVQGVVVTNKEEAHAAWMDKLYHSLDGRGLQEVSRSPLSIRWLFNPDRIFPRIFIRAIQLRCNLLRTKVRNSRGGRSDHSVLCRGNCGQPESLAHILQSCWITHDARCARHNRVAKDLAKRLRKLGYTVFEELRVPTASSFIKPDVIAVRDGAAVVLDVSIVDNYRSQFAWTDKIAKYGTDSHNAAIQSVLHTLGCDVNSVSHSPVIISFRGIIFPSSSNAILRLGLPSYAVTDSCLLTVLGSLKTYDTFIRGTWR